MKFSAKTDYACRALLELSLHWPNKEPMQLSTIAKKQKIPIQFLNHILIQLKQLKYVESSRGKNGGYILAKSPDKICLSDVVEDLGHELTQKNTSLKRHVFKEVWDTIDQLVLETMKKITFETLVHKYNAQQSVLTYQI